MPAGTTAPASAKTAPPTSRRSCAQQAQAAKEQIHTKTRAQDYTQNLDFLNRGAILQCPSCQAKLTPDQKFCPSCGTPNSAAKAQERNCTSCGEALKPEQKFCPSCGTKN